MGTKRDQEEPRRELRASDPAAPHLLRIMAALKRHHFGMAEVFLSDAIAELANDAPADDGEFLEMLVCSDQMTAWRGASSTTPAGGCNAPFAAHAIPKSESTDTPNAGPAAA